MGRDFCKNHKPFSCEVVYYSTSGNNQNSEYQSVSLEELFKTCDIISVHVTLNEKKQKIYWDTKS